jgi:hypothetical protein
VRRHTWEPTCTTFQILACCEYCPLLAPVGCFPLTLSRFGPNTFPAFNSVIFAVEVQVDYLVKSLISPLLDGLADVIEVTSDTEEEFVKGLDNELSDTVFSAGCSNWYINSAGRNSASWPGAAATFWQRTYFPNWKGFKRSGGDHFWPLRRAYRQLAGLHLLGWLGLTLFVTAAVVMSTGRQSSGIWEIIIK